LNNVSSASKALAAWPAAAGMAIGLLATLALAAPPDPALPPASPHAVTTAGSAAPPAGGAAPAAGSVAPASSAQADAGEPRANTSASADDAIGTAGAGGSPPARSSARQGASGTITKPAAQKAPGAADRVDLGTATVTGDREQPKVMYVVPWKSSDIGDLSGKPMNSLLDEALAPVDRDEFKREVAYFDAVKADRSQNGTPKPAANPGEK
jgi:hypothetical protein